MIDIKTRNLNINNKGQVYYLTFPSFNKYSFQVHGFSTRLGGVSSGIYESMNLGFNRGDDYGNVLENYKLFSEALGINHENLVFSSQTHGDVIRDVKASDIGKGITKEKEYDSVDGLITNVPGIFLVGLFADCVPIYFLDPVKRVAAIAHSGWRGTVLQIGRKMADKFIEYGSSKEDILVGIGPSIGPCCFQVGAEVAEEFKSLPFITDSFIKNDGRDKYKINLWEINKAILINSGINEKNITVTDVCTKCNSKFLFSHRGSNGKRGSLAGIIGLK
ncbi:MAG: peptidoglycan editing factor PgeF [Bacillota bacterium]|nr:peptidoglycan editing factor PgeF [Bacillota bacterium]